MFRHARIGLPILAAALLAAPAPAQEPREPQIPDLKVEKYTLPNGLEVILHRDDTLPVVGVNVWYKVGSKDEKVGRTGFAHLFEHLMFQGSQHSDDEFFGPLESIGASINGSTNTDRTNYFETLPSNGLERALWLEADRMGFLLPALTQEKLDNQRDVVKNERRQRVDNVPYGQAYERILAAMYPEGHPYHHSVIGSLADLSAASLDDVANFFRTYYAPNNASLVVAGDFDPAEAKRLVAKYFGPIPRGPEIERPKPETPALDGPKHEKMTDRVALARASLSWHTVPLGHPDEQALDVLAAVLGQLDKENRLFRALQYDARLVANASAYHGASLLAGTFNVTLSALPGQADRLDEIVAAADREIRRLADEGPTADEVAKALTSVESRLILGLQSTQRKADFLNSNNVLRGDPLAYKDELRKLFAVTPEDVRRVARTYLTPNRLRFDVLPGAQAVRAPEVEVDRKGQVAIAPVPPEIRDDFDRSKMPEPGPAPDFAPPPVVRKRLSNGLEVLVAERRALPIVSTLLLTRGGQTLVPRGKEGLADLTAGLMTEGTASLDSLELAGELARIGARLNAGFSIESGSLSLTTLTKHVDRGLELFKDVLLNASFPEKELERLRTETLAGLAARADDPVSVARLVFPKLLFSANHPYGRFETPATVKAVTAADAAAFAKSVFTPGNCALIVVGDVDADAIVAKLETALRDWTPGPVPNAPEVPTVSDPDTTVYLVDKPGSAQSVLLAGHTGITRLDPDYFAIELMNAVLGGQFSSRINLNLREEKGYTYGARTGFSARKGVGPFLASTSVQTAVTAPALSELVRELTEITGARPITEAEFGFAQTNLVRGFPSEFETTSGFASNLAQVALYGLPDDYFTTYQDKLEAVTVADANAVAAKRIKPGNLTILVVGDRAKIESELRALPFVKDIVFVDAEGDPVPNGNGK